MYRSLYLCRDLYLSIARYPSVCRSLSVYTFLSVYRSLPILLEQKIMLLISGAGIAQWLERRARDRKVAGSSPDRTGGKLFFLFFLQGQLSVLNHISVSVLHLCYAAARKKRSRSSIQMCRWKVTCSYVTHSCTLCM